MGEELIWESGIRLNGMSGKSNMSKLLQISGSLSGVSLHTSGLLSLADNDRAAALAEGDKKSSMLQMPIAETNVNKRCGIKWLFLHKSTKKTNKNEG